MKLISICPSNTELVAYLGLTSSLIGVDNFSDWPEEINGLPRLGPDLKIDMDKVEELHPDLVLASLSVPGMEQNLSNWKNAKSRMSLFRTQKPYKKSENVFCLSEKPLIHMTKQKNCTKNLIVLLNTMTLSVIK